MTGSDEKFYKERIAQLERELVNTAEKAFEAGELWKEYDDAYEWPSEKPIPLSKHDYLGRLIVSQVIQEKRIRENISARGGTQGGA